jgi:uncharacterized protein YkvS
VQETASWKKDIVADISPRKRLEKYRVRNGFLFKRGYKGIIEEIVALKKGIIVDIPLLEKNIKV